MGTVKSAEEVARKALEKAMGKTIKASSTGSESSGSVPAQPSLEIVQPPPEVRGTSGDGGGNSLPPSDSGGGGGGYGGRRDHSNQDPFFDRKDLKIAMYAGIFAIVSMLYVLVHGIIVKQSSDVMSLGVNAPAQQAQIQHQTPVATTPPASSQVSKQVIYARMFSCGNATDREEGYARNDMHYLDASSASLQAGPGCVLAKVSGEVKSLSAKSYRLSVADDAIPGNYYNCGDIKDGNTTGHDDSIQKCISFINRWSGKDMRIAVLDGGYVNIN